MKDRTLMMILLTLLVVGCGKSYEGYKGTADIRLIPETPEFSSLEKIIQLPIFKDKTVFVQVWSTESDPCLREFDYLPQIVNNYPNDEVEFLFLCTGYSEPDNREVWAEILDRKDIKGHHVLMSTVLSRKIIYQINMNSINNTYPYNLVAKNGHNTLN